MSRDQVDPDEMMFHMNNDLFITKTSGMFVTCVLGKYDLITQEVSWVNGGHQPAIIRDNNGEYQNFDSEAPPMGVILQKNKSIYKINKQVLNGKKFYVFTDGLSESLNTEGQEIGIEGSIKIIEDSYTKDSKKHLSDVSKQIIKNSKSGKLDDDLTLISIG
jgi:Amt family ammonium transporter